MKKFRIHTGLVVHGQEMHQIVHAYRVEKVGLKDLHLLDNSMVLVGIVHYANGIVKVEEMPPDQI